MSLTYKEARDEIFAVFHAAWATTGYPVHYEDVRKQRSKNEEPWAVVSLKHASGFQSTLNGAVGSQRFTRLGFLTIQIFTPNGNGLQEAYDLASMLSNAFEGVSTPGGVWFRNTRVNEIGRDGEFFQMNIVIDFVYDLVK